MKKGEEYKLGDLETVEIPDSVKNIIKNIKYDNNEIVIPNTLLTTAEWNQVKVFGNKLSAYRVTILNNVNDKDVKIGKIAMYENGAAVIEKGN